ncbi:hypothetical protein AKO1_000324 [Acrasis kona]|uniref:Uncharacterized protein n=1 Tax=Acrasis kona TaxID=1008807 RepID=A0AAW2ZEY0_9EUKA
MSTRHQVRHKSNIFPDDIWDSVKKHYYNRRTVNLGSPDKWFKIAEVNIGRPRFFLSNRIAILNKDYILAYHTIFDYCMIHHIHKIMAPRLIDKQKLRIRNVHVINQNTIAMDVTNYAHKNYFVIKNWETGQDMYRLDHPIFMWFIAGQYLFDTSGSVYHLTDVSSPIFQFDSPHNHYLNDGIILPNGKYVYQYEGEDDSEMRMADDVCSKNEMCVPNVTMYTTGIDLFNLRKSVRSIEMIDDWRVVVSHKNFFTMIDFRKMNIDYTVDDIACTKVFLMSDMLVGVITDDDQIVVIDIKNKNIVFRMNSAQLGYTRAVDVLVDPSLSRLYILDEYGYLHVIQCGHVPQIHESMKMWHYVKKHSNNYFFDLEINTQC